MKDILDQSKPLFLILTILLPKKTHDKSNLPSHEKTLQKKPSADDESANRFSTRLVF
jgi:hypothetical protein